VAWRGKQARHGVVVLFFSTHYLWEFQPKLNPSDARLLSRQLEDPTPTARVSQQRRNPHLVTPRAQRRERAGASEACVVQDLARGIDN